MSKVNNGGAAFPFQALRSDGLPAFEFSVGMSLRDYFAAQALPAIISATSAGQHEPGKDMAESVGINVEAKIAFDTYRIADAMIAERERRTP